MINDVRPELGYVIPMGHEWVTRLSALEVIGGDPIKPDPNDPRKKWTKGLAKNTDLSSDAAQAELARIKKQPFSEQRYLSTYKVVYDAIIGQRWVDIAGFNVTKGKLPGGVDCWDAVAQEAIEVQYDHFMRRPDDRGGAGGVYAAHESQQRFIDYFVAAATAPPMQMLVWDGGGYSELVEVDQMRSLLPRHRRTSGQHSSGRWDSLSDRGARRPHARRPRSSCATGSASMSPRCAPGT